MVGSKGWVQQQQHCLQAGARTRRVAAGGGLAMRMAGEQRVRGAAHPGPTTTSPCLLLLLCLVPHTQGTPPLCACCLLARSREGHAARRRATCAQEGELGAGSYGTVVHAVDSATGQHVAIKLLRRGAFVSGVAAVVRRAHSLLGAACARAYAAPRGAGLGRTHSLLPCQQASTPARVRPPFPCTRTRRPCPTGAMRAARLCTTPS